MNKLNLVEVRKAEIPKAGWMYEPVMKLLLGEELAELLKYPLRAPNEK